MQMDKGLELQPVLVRNHPQLSYKGVPSWPPKWIWLDGPEDKHPKGEVGVLRAVLLSKDRGGKETCAARLINKNKLESAVLAKIQEQILTPTNIRSYIQRVMESALKSQDEPSAEQDTVRLALNDVQTRLQRWENALESGELSIEHAAQRIKELHEQRQELLKKKQALDRDRPGAKTVSAIPTSHMDVYVAEMRRRLMAKQIGAKREFLQEVLSESARQQRQPHLQAAPQNV